ncbi:DNA polymerase III subunit beta [Aquihabitans daechungensis]|uniref:DNA polymerase III subunit beta n=1 Tax=Aquihabitans daechungensis TaxID=1052257 RepID=UPI003B9E007E
MFSVVVDASALRRGVADVAQIVPTLSPATLSWQGLWISFDQERLTVETTDGVQSLAVEIAVDESRGEGGVVLASRLVARLLRQIPKGPVRLASDGSTLTIEAGRFAATLPALAAREVTPPLGPPDSRYNATLPASAITDGFHHLALVLGHHWAWRTGLTSVELTPMHETIRFTGTDMTQLALTEVPIPPGSIPPAEVGRSFLISGSAVRTIALLMPVDGDVDVVVGNDQIELATERVTVRSLASTGPFPDYQPVMATHHDQQVVLSRSALDASIERVSLLAHRRAATLWIRITANEVILRSTDMEIGEALEMQSATVTGDSRELGLYLWGFLAVVRRLRGEDLVIEAGPPDKALVVYTTQHPGFRYHLLPIATAPPPSILNREAEPPVEQRRPEPTSQEDTLA